MFFGYNTNGFAHHSLELTIPILAELGYRGIAITLDYHSLDPFESDWTQQADRFARLLAKHQLKCVIETGSRFLLNPREKHQPTLLSADPAARQLRVEFLKRSIFIANVLQADAVSFWSGTSSALEDSANLWCRLVEGCRFLSEYAEKSGVRLAFEPEPGMLVDTMSKFADLHRLVDHPHFGLTIDIGHLQCQREWPFHEHFERWKHCLWNIHIEDMKAGIHDHLFFGEGEMDFPDILYRLRQINYKRGVYVELSRHSHQAVETARRSLEFLKQY